MKKFLPWVIAVLAVGLLGASQVVETGAGDAEAVDLVTGQFVLGSTAPFNTWAGAQQVIIENLSSTGDSDVRLNTRSGSPTLPVSADKSLNMPIQLEQFDQLRSRNTDWADTLVKCTNGNVRVYFFGN